MPRPDGRSITPAATQQLVTIEEVDLTKRLCHVRDKQGASHAAIFRNTGPVSQIPMTGELWVATRMSSMEWNLVARRETEEEANVKNTLSPGDTHVRAGTKLYINGQEIDVDLNGNVDALLQVPGTFELQTGKLQIKLIGSPSLAVPIGATRMERKVTSGATVNWALSFIPVDLQTVMLFDNGLLVDPGGLSLATSLLTFPSIATGHILVVYYQTLV